VNNKGKEFVKFTKVVSHQEKQEKKATNHSYYASETHANAPHMSYHDFDASYVLMKNKHGKVITKFARSDKKRSKTCVWVPKSLMTNMKGPNQVWVPKNKA
jgi:formylmethanofuran dehydrogenase subunit D